MDLTAADALTLRMSSLLLNEPPTPGNAPRDVAGVVSWFGAMQAQDLASGLWSLGARLPGSTVDDVNAALERREALRTWPMRGTVHFVPSRDAHWMLDLMGVRALTTSARRRTFLGLDEATADRAVDVLGASLAGGGRMTRAECVKTMADAGIGVTGQIGYHLLWYASQRGVTCIAPNFGKEQTFVLLDDWVPDPVRLGRDEALATIALRYFRSHGPAPRKDLAGWTGLPMSDVRAGIAGAGDALTRVDVDGGEMYAATEQLDAWHPGEQGATGRDLLALPGFDEYLLGYKDRTLMLADPGHLAAVIPGGNGVFQPTIVRDGRVIATWKRTTGRAKVRIDVRPLATVSARDRTKVEAALQPYGQFVRQPVEVRWA